MFSSIQQTPSFPYETKKDPRKRSFGISTSAWRKSGTRTPGPGTQDPTQWLKMGHGTPLKFKSGTPGPLSKFKSGTPGPSTMFKSGIPSPFFNEFIFFRIFLRFFYLFIFVSFLNKIQKNINCE